MKKLSVYQRIKRASQRRKGLRLSPRDCQDLYMRDYAFRTVADRDEFPESYFDGHFPSNPLISSASTSAAPRDTMKD